MLERMRTRTFWMVMVVLVLTSVIVCLLGGGPQPTLHTIVSGHISQLKQLKVVQEYVQQQQQQQESEEEEEDPSERFLKQLGFTDHPRLYEPGQANVTLPVFVSAVHSRHSLPATVSVFLASLQRFYPGHSLELYALDLAPSAFSMVEKLCNVSTNCTLRQFALENYPSHVSNLKVFAYRPIIIQEVLNRYGVVFWLDLQLEVTSSQLEELLPAAAKHGLVSWSIHQPTSALTHPGMFEFFHTRQDLFYFHRMVDPAHLGLFNLERIHYKLMKPWVHCALTAHCIAPIGAQALGCRFDKKPLFRYSGCHHYDMSALNVLLGLLTDFDQGSFTARDQDKFFLPQGGRQELLLNTTDSGLLLEP